LAPGIIVSAVGLFYMSPSAKRTATAWMKQNEAANIKRAAETYADNRLPCPSLRHGFPATKALKKSGF
jgi:hypothetical protein